MAGRRMGIIEMLPWRLFSVYISVWIFELYENLPVEKEMKRERDAK